MEPAAQSYQSAREATQLYQQGEFGKAASMLRLLPMHADLIQARQSRLEKLAWELAAVRARGDAAEREAQLAREKKELEQELADLQKAQPYDRAVQLRLADAWARTGFPDGAILLGQKLLEAGPDPLLSAHLAKWLWQAGEKEAALDRIKEAVNDPALHEQAVPELSRMMAEVEGAEAGMALLSSSNSQPAQAQQAILLFGAGRYEEAAGTFAKLAEAKKDGSYQVDQARALLAAGDYAALRVFCAGQLRSRFDQVSIECQFLEALAIFALGDYESAAARLGRFLADHPTVTRAGPARLMLADAWLATGKLTEAGAILSGIPPDAAEYPASLLKQAEVLRLLGDAEGMKECLQLLTIERAGTPAAAEAWYRLGRYQMEAGDRAAALKLYLEKSETLGNDPAAIGVEKMLRDLPLLFPPRGDQALVRDGISKALGDMVERADGKSQELLAIRGLWANGLLFRRIDPTVAAFYMKAVAARIQPGKVSPYLLVDVADGLRRAGELQTAERFYRAVMEHPGQARAIGRAQAGLGFLAAARGRDDEALRAFERYLKRGADPEILGDVLITTAKLRQEKGDKKGSEGLWETLMNSAEVTPAERQMAAQALGDRKTEEGDLNEGTKFYRKALESELGNSVVAITAGIKLGETLEKMREPEKAATVYRAMLGREDLKGYRQLETVQARLKNLGGEMP